jgi:hypothetical protein
MLKRKVYQYIIHSALHDVLHRSHDLYLSQKEALEEAERISKNELFKHMKGNFYTTKEYTVHITNKAVVR